MVFGVKGIGSWGLQVLGFGVYRRLCVLAAWGCSRCAAALACLGVAVRAALFLGYLNG